MTVADESEVISLFDTSHPKQGQQPNYSQNIKEALGSPPSLKQKDLFGMGYPYYICANANTVCVSTDFGICVLSY